MAFGRSKTTVMLQLQLFGALMFMVHLEAAIDYRDALEKSLIFFEGQRSGALPSTQRAAWRGDSGLTDGSDVGVDLVGGYYDAGDNVKFGVPMAFTATLLSWGLIEYGAQVDAAGQLNNAHETLTWITDYLLKCHTGPTQLWVQVGDPAKDHACWERPEDMDTLRLSYQINATHPGSEPAGETAAALAAASIVFRSVNATYSNALVEAAISIFSLGDTYRGSFNDAAGYYSSFSGYLDELLWGAAWLYKATGSTTYLDYVVNNASSSYTMNQFGWDNKWVGVQVLLSKYYLAGTTSLASYKTQADVFVCYTLPTSSQKTVTITPGGLLFIQDDNNIQYVTTSSFLMAIYSDYLTNGGSTVTCGGTTFQPSALYTFAKSQVDYILGSNPLNMSFMVGHGDKYPTQVHHRGASIVSIHTNSAKVSCNDGYNNYYNVAGPNPNVHVGALVGGPSSSDTFNDIRSDWNHLEPTTYMNAPIVALLSKIIADYD